MSAEETQRTTDDQTLTAGSQWRVYLAIVVCLVVTGLLSSGRLVAIAERMAFGAGRDTLLRITLGIDGFAQTVGLDRPAAWAYAVVGPRDALPSFRSPQTALLDATPTRSATPSALAEPTVAPSSTATHAPLTSTPAATATSAATAAPNVAASETPLPSATPTRPPATATSPPSPTLSPEPSQAPTAVASQGETPADARPVSPDNPLRVLTAGDSFAQPVGYDLNGYANRHKMIITQLDFKISSGVARPDFFDWPTRMRAIMAQEPAPEAVVFVVGGNDTQNMWNDQRVFVRGTEAWQTEYSRRAGEVMDIIGERGARVYWVGMPITRDEERNRYIQVMNQAILDAVASRPWVHFVDIWELFKDKDGNFATYLPDHTGEMVQVRQNDGIHLTLLGNTWVTALVYQAIEHDFGFTSP